MKSILSLVFLGLLSLGAVHGQVETYPQCIQCLSTNRTGAYYCQSNQQCLPINSPQCAPSQIVPQISGCLQGFAQCQNVTFARDSVGTYQEQGFGLLPGYGCYITIDRLFDGSVGTVAIVYDDPLIKVIDNYVMNYTSGMQLPLPLTNYGWAPRTILVVNTNSQPSSFTAQFSLGRAMVASMATLLFSLINLL